MPAPPARYSHSSGVGSPPAAGLDEGLEEAVEAVLEAVLEERDERDDREKRGTRAPGPGPVFSGPPVRLIGLRAPEMNGQLSLFTGKRSR